jgi:hypothetical protein
MLLRPVAHRPDLRGKQRGANGQALSYMYFEEEPLRRFRRRELLTRDEAQRIATIFAKLPEPASKAFNRDGGSAKLTSFPGPEQRPNSRIFSLRDK